MVFRSLLFLRILPAAQVVAPGDADAGVGVENLRLILGTGGVVEEQNFADFRFGAEIEEKSGGDPAARPLPAGAAEKGAAAVAPGDEVAAPPEGDAVRRRVDHQEFIAVPNDAHIFAAVAGADALQMAAGDGGDDRIPEVQDCREDRRSAADCNGNLDCPF